MNSEELSYLTFLIFLYDKMAAHYMYLLNTLSNVYNGHVIRDTFWRLVNFQRKVRDRLVLRYQVLGHAIAEIRLPGVVPSQSPPCT